MFKCGRSDIKLKHHSLIQITVQMRKESNAEMAIEYEKSQYGEVLSAELGKEIWIGSPIQNKFFG